MSQYYPQAVLKLRVLPEDFKLSSDASLQKPYELLIVARNITVNVNDHKTADSFSCDIEYKNFPFDPRMNRYVGVTIYLKDMKSLYKSDGSLNTIEPASSAAVFSGFVDEETVTFDDVHRTVHFEGRDFTSLLIDQKYKEQVPVPLTATIDVIINNFLATFPATKNLKISNQTGRYDKSKREWDNPDLPILGSFYPDFGSPLAGSRNPGVKESYWDIIQDICRRAGMICFIHLDTVVLKTPRNLFSPDNDVKFIYGINVKNLSWKRKLGRLKNFNILVRCRVGKEVLTAKIPEEATPEWCKAYGIERKPAVVPVLKPDGSLDNTQEHPAPYIAFPITNISNKDQLIRIGQATYEDYSRQQLEGTIETREMVSHSGTTREDRNWKEYDLTQLEIGQPIAIELETDDLQEISRLKSNEVRTNYLVKRGYAREVASAFAKSMGKFSSRFFTKSYVLMLNSDSGFSIKINFINIIELSNNGL